jgi:hypothetical protein
VSSYIPTTALSPRKMYDWNVPALRIWKSLNVVNRHAPKRVYHISQAPDGMAQLAKEVKTLAQKSGLPVPAIRKVLGMEPVEGR